MNSKEQLNPSAPKQVVNKVCPEGQYLNPVTNRCNKIKTNTSTKKKSEPKKVVNNKVCPEGQYLNPVTNRCNKIKTNTRKKNPMLNDYGTEKLIDY